MKHCLECGHKLPPSTPKHCPNCGALLAAKAQEKASAPKNFSQQVMDAARVLLGVFLLFAFFLAIIFYPIAQWERSRAAGAQYYSQFTQVSKDFHELEFLAKQYDSLKIDDYTFNRKVAAAADFAARAKHAAVTRGYFATFISANQDALGRWGANHSLARSEMESGNFAVLSAARRMSADLKQFVGAEKNQTRTVLGILTPKYVIK